MNILLTGGFGLLGRELQKLHTYTYVPSHEEMDIADYDDVTEYLAPRKIDLIVHCAAYTQVEKAERERERCWATNVHGTRNLCEPHIPLLYISTEYAFDGTEAPYKASDTPNPKNFYAMTKVMGEQYVWMNPMGKTIRCILKPRPWKYEAAFTDQWTTGGYVDNMAYEINLAIKLFAVLPKVVHIGTGRKSIFELASQTREVSPISRSISKTPLPEDTSLDHSRWDAIKAAHT